KVGADSNRNFIATEYIEGQTLRDRMASHQPMTIADVLDVAIGVANALTAAHDAGVLHRDIKPENVMLRPDGYVKVLDFGLAKLTTADDEKTIQASDTRQGLILGTPAYMSPEQARGDRVDYRSDQFSFGAMLYELATGRAPFVRESAVETAAAVIGVDPDTLDRACPQMPPPLRWAIERCLAKSPSDRYAATRDLHRDLAAVHERISDVMAASPQLPRSNLPMP